jgi:3-methylcrotonyl-CoA carboxylase alpha subunit
MRIVERREDFPEALESCKRESLKAFKDDRVIIEKYIARSSHIEVQVFGDKFNNYVHLYERDCSIQRRHQKVVEEAPSNISDAIR